MTRSLLLVLVAACGASNETILRELESDARARPDAAADRLAGGGIRALPLRGAAKPVTLDLLPRKLATVLGEVNGATMPLVLDTGTSGVWLPPALARRARVYLPPGKTHHAVSPGYARSGRMGVVNSLSFGGLRFGPGVVVVSVGGERRRSHGIVGTCVLSHFRVTFDYRRREVTLVPHGRPAHTQPLFTTVVINGKPLLLMIDSGANAVYLDPWAARELGLISKSMVESMAGKADRAWGVNYRWVELAKVEVAGRTFKSVKAGVVNTFEGLRSSDGRRPAGLLGLSGLGELAWTLDYGTQQLSVR